MSTLHLIRTANYTAPHFESALRILNESDAIVFIDDGCYNLNHPLMQSEQVKKLENNQRIFTIETHCIARAVIINTHYTTIDMSALVDLSFDYKKVMTWQ